MKQILLILSFFIISTSYGQVDNYDLLTKNMESSNIKSITKLHESRHFPNGEKIFKLEFNKQQQLMAIVEYQYLTGPDNPIVLRQEIRYDETGKKAAIFYKAPDGNTATDTLLYNDQNDLIKKLRIVNGKVVRSWDYSGKKEIDDAKKEFDDKGKLVKMTKANGDYTTYTYDLNDNLTQELRFQDAKEHEKYTFQYNKNSRLTNMETYLLYIGDGTKDPLKYYFEYEYFD